MPPPRHRRAGPGARVMEVVEVMPTDTRGVELAPIRFEAELSTIDDTSLDNGCSSNHGCSIHGAIGSSGRSST